MKGKTIQIIIYAILIIAIAACGTTKKMRMLQQEQIGAGLQLPEKLQLPDYDSDTINTEPHRDTIMVVDDYTGKKLYLMNAVEDMDGEMVAHDELQAAYVTARFRNVAERNGKVGIEFQLVVPQSMQDSKWQIRFHPLMYILQDTVKLDDVIITGNEYRKQQLRGYQQYERFLSRIINDNSAFVDLFQLEQFLRRNIPQIYAFKRDSSFVSDEQFASLYGVTEAEAVEHYTDKLRLNRNERRKGKVTEMFNRYVKAPIVSEGIRLDTVVVATNGDIIYNYTQSIQTRPELRKVDITLAGDIFEQEKQVYKVPTSEPLTFYISSLSAFVDPTVKYMTRIVERKVEANTACYIDFEQGSDIIDDQLGHNLEEISRIKTNIASLIENIEFEMDSIVVTASASPEGSWAFNTNLSKKRSNAVSAYFEKYIKHYTDSLDREKGFFIDFDSGAVSRESLSEVPFISRYNPENWTMLDVLVAQDETISEDEKFIYNLRKEIEDPDIREAEMQSLSGYLYMRENLYPRLRTVKFDFHLHRKGMVKDTIHTTVIDSAYMAGVEAVVNHDYQKGVTLLRPYNDYNSAVAFCAMGYDESALQILTNLDKNAQVNYMLAIIYSRRNDEENAVQHYLRSCRDNPTYLHRGMLDPEISLLIKKYGLNNLIN